MRTLEVRRHTMRRKPGEQLSKKGKSLARLVGGDSESFNLVVTSTVPRAIETAIAMRLKVDRSLSALGNPPNEVFDEVGWPKSFAEIACTVALGGYGGKFASEQAKLWQNIVKQIPDSQSALIITHGLIVELGAIASKPDADFEAWGGAIGYCEGVRLSFEKDCKHIEMIRMSEQDHLVDN